MALSEQIAKPATTAATPSVGTEYRPPEEDLSTGRLAQFDDFSNPVFKRAGSLASRVSASRGLTNSSIATGTAIGSVLDKAVDMSIADSGSLVSAGLNSSKNATTIQQQVMSDKSASQRLGAQLDSAEKEGAATRKVQELGINTDAALRREGFATEERISTNNIQAADTRAMLERENQNFLQSRGIAAETTMAAMKDKYQVEAMNRASVGMAWDNLQQGIASIDPNATKESQTTQFHRLMASFDARMNFLSIVSKPVASTTSTTSTAGQPQVTPLDQAIASTKLPAYGVGGGGSYNINVGQVM